MRTIRFIKRLHLDTHLSLTLTQEPAELCTPNFSDHWQNSTITNYFHLRRNDGFKDERPQGKRGSKCARTACTPGLIILCTIRLFSFFKFKLFNQVNLHESKLMMAFILGFIQTYPGSKHRGSLERKSKKSVIFPPFCFIQ